MNINHPSSQDIPALRELWKEAFGDSDKYLDAFFATAFAPERCLCIEGGKAACYWLSCSCRGEKTAYLYAVATAQAFQGQGLCRALIDAAKKALVSQGYAGILLVPGSEPLRTMYAKMGFRDATTLREYTVGNGLRVVPERHIGRCLHWEEYAQARQALLPEGAAIEGKAFFRFLASQLDFYRYGNAIFACMQENDHLYIPEFLGESEQIPQILAAFGCIHATVRTPGQGKAWAMYCPLSDTPEPTHFSFALD